MYSCKINKETVDKRQMLHLKGVLNMKRTKSVGWGELIFGIIFIFLGLYTFKNPSAAIVGVAAVYGVVALITGIVDIAFYISLEKRTGFAPGISLVTGVLSVITGLLFLFNLSVGSWVVAILFPIWFISHCISGLSRLPFVRMAAGNSYYYLTLIVNIIGLVLGFSMLFDPAVSYFSVSLLVGFYLVMMGVDSFVFGINLLDSSRIR